LYALGLDDDELASIASGLGSDVAFLVHGGSAIVEGLGERVERHDEVPDLHAVLAFPSVACPTGAVYGAFDREAQTARVDAARVRSLARSRPAPHDCFNDLAGPACAIAPSLRDDIEELSALAERPAHVSGSGSTIFVLCDDPLHAAALAEASIRRLDLPAVAVRSTPRPRVTPADSTQS
jgi:4-diphosphocytidyl-2-C-methyl-D-erythritol kinase